MKLRYKASLSLFSFSAIFLALIVYYFYLNTAKLALIDAAEMLSRSSTQISHQIEVTLREKIKLVKALAEADVVYKLLQESNSQYEKLPPDERAQSIKKDNEKWMAAQRWASLYQVSSPW